MKPKQIMEDLWESSNSGIIGFEAVVKFYQTATTNQIQQIEKVCRSNDWYAFKNLIKKAEVPIETESNLPPTIDDPPNYLTGNHAKSKT